MRLLTIIAALLATSISTAATPINGWYSSLFGGYTYVPGNMSNTRNDLLIRTNANYLSGYDAGGNIGFKSNPMRYEGELTYMNVDLKSFRLNRVAQSGITGYNNALFAMANVLYDFQGITCPIQPFLGAGIGYGWINIKANSTGPLGPTSFSGSNDVFAYQATGGLTYNFAENYALSLGYRYLATENVSKLGRMFQAHMGNLSVIYRFDGRNYQ